RTSRRSKAVLPRSQDTQRCGARPRKPRATYDARVLVTDPWFYVAAVPAVLLFGVSKGGFGGGLGIVAVPLMALTVPVAQAAATMLPVLLAMDVVAVIAYRRVWDRRDMVILAPAALAGIVVGTLTFRVFDDSV